ncbi:MAG: gliding motility protein GldN [bacterium]
MKKAFAILGLTILLASMATAQNNELNPDEFHTYILDREQRPMPYLFIRESDIVWSTDIWKTISTHELFNQFFYFPSDEYVNYGKKSLAYILWDAMAAGEIPIYEDDDLKIPIDNELFVKRYTRADTIMLEIGYDDDDNELYETIIKPRFFEGAEIYFYSLRETWFVGRQDTRQDSRRIALAPIKETYRDLGNGKEIYLGNLPLFWVPMQNPHVRELLARYTAYIDPSNLVRQPSWDWVFVNQHYSAIITRESNDYNRKISDYVTGENAVIEADNIEAKVFEIEDGMWEY